MLQAGTDPTEKGFIVSCVRGWGSHIPNGVLRDREKLLSIPLALPVWLQAGAGVSALSLEAIQDTSIAEALPSLPRSTQVLLLQQVAALSQAGFRAVAKGPP